MPPPADGVQSRLGIVAASACRATAASPIAGRIALPARCSSATRRTTPSSSGCTVTTPTPPARRNSGRGAVTSAQVVAGTSAGTRQPRPAIEVAVAVSAVSANGTVAAAMTAPGARSSAALNWASPARGSA